MGTKNNPGTFDCYANAEPDEPMFILLARDPLAPMLVRLWGEMRALTRGQSSKVTEAMNCAVLMEAWAVKRFKPASPPETTTHDVTEGEARVDKPANG